MFFVVTANPKRDEAYGPISSHEWLSDAVKAVINHTDEQKDENDPSRRVIFLRYSKDWTQKGYQLVGSPEGGFICESRKHQEFGVLGRVVLVRTYSAGVHIGLLVAHEDKQVMLLSSRRIWQFQGCFTLSEVANGYTVGKYPYTRLSAEVGEILLTEAVEIIPLNIAAIYHLYALPAYVPNKDD